MSTLTAVAVTVIADAFGMHNGNNMGSGWFVVMVLFWGLVIFAVVWLVRSAATDGIEHARERADLRREPQRASRFLRMAGAILPGTISDYAQRH